MNSRQILDQVGHPRQGPESRLVTMGSGTGEQCARHIVCLLCRQLRLTARRAFAGQRGTAAFQPRLLPAVSDLTGYSQTAGHFGCRMILGEEFARLPAALFHLGVVSCLRHADTLHANPRYVILLCESQ